MNLRNRPELQDRLAAEYVLGTLRGRARARFRRWMRDDAQLRIVVAGWEARLAPMAEAVAPVSPPRRVWSAISERIAGTPAVRDGLWNSLGFWRGLGLAASGATAALFTALVLFAPDAPLPAPAPQIVRVPASELPAAYVAVLSDPGTRKPVLMVAAARHSDQLTVKRLDEGIVVADRSLELWALPPGGAPRSLGLVAAQARHTLKLQATADRTLGDIPALAISLEPAGGSPTGAPTGPVLYTGPCIRYW
jgi:anti-sigma-K factor RskA